MPEGTYRIADRIIKICSVYESVQKFCADYTCAGEPFLTVRTDENDIRAEQLKSAREAAYEGRETLFYPADYLETLAVYRKLVTAMASDGVLLMHGSAAAVDGQAYLFTAKSGTGKSTHTRLWREVFKDRCLMVNDDKPLIRLTDRGALIYGTPWDGKHRLSRNIKVPLKAVCFLSRDTKNHIEKTDFAKVLPLLIGQTFRPDNAEAAAAVMGLIKKLGGVCEFYSLGCNTEKEAAVISYKGMSGQ